ncbi:hypothetical protein HAX54_050847 [Datura stramonium]|uniref:Tubulin-folding cofactor D C-terminal domain-containing protein n=1 Tax=Datura stramonium TaxID=4076 RepID=A0ABS8SXU9_DATST|nr:hypothetical protein [Datura stramonium]
MFVSAAVAALKSFIPAYIVPLESKGFNAITSRYLEQLTDPNVAARRGSALALGVLPFKFLSEGWKDILPKLCAACEIESKEIASVLTVADGGRKLHIMLNEEQLYAVQDNPEERDVEARVNAVKDLYPVCEILTETRDHSHLLSAEECISLYVFIKNEVMQTLFKALDDYSKDNRGDVGSWVREAAIDGLERCTYIYAKRGLKGLSSRDPEQMELGSVPAFSYPPVVLQLLGISCYSKYVISELVISIGGLQDSLRKPITQCFEFLQSTDENVNGSKTIENLFSKKIFLNMETAAFCAGVLEALNIELKGSKAFNKLYAGIAILGYISSVPEHMYQSGRKAAEQVLSCAPTEWHSCSEDKLDKALEIISKLAGAVMLSKKKSLELCATCNLDGGTFSKANVGTSRRVVEQAPTGDENSSYSSLVGSAGF